MPENKRATLDSPALIGRVRGYQKLSPPSRCNDVFYPVKKTVQIKQPPVARVGPKQVIENLQKNIEKKSKKLFKLESKKSLAITAASAIFIIVGAAFSFYGYHSNQQVQAQVKAMKASGDQDHPSSSNDYDETPVTNVWSYQVSPDMPRFLRIPSLGVFARVKRVSTDNNNVMQAPRSIYDAGWYDGSSKPGEPGAMFIDGHVSGPTSHGVFYSIKNLKAGDKIEIERGDGHKFQFKVVANEKYDADKVDMAKAMRPYIAGRQGLNLMTCTGRFLPKEQAFAKRVVVYSVLE